MTAPRRRPASVGSTSPAGPALREAEAGARGRLAAAAPFWLSLSLVPIVLATALLGGWALALPPLAAWGLYSALDGMIGRDTANADPDTPPAALFWHDLILRLWFPVQAAVVFGLVWYAARQTHLGPGELAGLFFGVGILTGTVGIVYAHELMHRQGAGLRLLGDLLMAMALYGHFRSEHLLVHHVHVGTPRDAVTARRGEGFWRFLLRVLPASSRSAWAAERARLARRDRPVWHLANPFWRYGAAQLAFLTLAVLLGGWLGLALFVWQAVVAVWQLELVNYVEHYGLARRRRASGRYEPVAPHHSWNADQAASNRLLVNLQRHSDHHVKPARPYPLLQTYPEAEAPTLPWGYPVMTLIALVPPLWRRVMHPRLADWRRRHHPDIADWADWDRHAA